MKTSRDIVRLFCSAVATVFVSVSITHATEESIAPWQQAASDGSSSALVELALFYGQDETRIDEQRAFDLLLIAANRFDRPEAQINLGVLYQFGGQGIEPNKSRAAYWYSRAAQSNDPGAVAKLADLYSRGIGTPVNFEKAAVLYKSAADSGLSDAQVELGYIYETGDLGQPDYPSALALYQQAAEQGNFIGQYNLAEMYELGKGVEVNLDQARKWYSLSADQGLEEAKEALQRLQ